MPEQAPETRVRIPLAASAAVVQRQDTGMNFMWALIEWPQIVGCDPTHTGSNPVRPTNLQGCSSTIDALGFDPRGCGFESLHPHHFYRRLVQRLERDPLKVDVGGSNPSVPAKYMSRGFRSYRPTGEARGGRSGSPSLSRSNRMLAGCARWDDGAGGESARDKVFRRRSSAG